MKDITIHPQATIKETMEALDKTAEKVLLILDDKQALTDHISNFLFQVGDVMCDAALYYQMDT